MRLRATDESTDDLDVLTGGALVMPLPQVDCTVPPFPSSNSIRCIGCRSRNRAGSALPFGDPCEPS
jgi:hypothetical protein